MKSNVGWGVRGAVLPPSPQHHHPPLALGSAWHPPFAGGLLSLFSKKRPSYQPEVEINYYPKGQQGNGSFLPGSGREL